MPKASLLHWSGLVAILGPSVPLLTKGSLEDRLPGRTTRRLSSEEGPAWE